MSKKTIAVSGGFDPIHVGHVRMILKAAEYGDVIVILNTDEWLEKKKGYTFMKWEERAEILKAISGVSNVVKCIDEDNTVCETLSLLSPTYFANGGDRKEGNVPEEKVCNDLGIEMLWGIGGNNKPQSSSWLVDAVRQKQGEK
jgi:D-beta-D-heptose 7-phosphate kinase/D-beta-D-heptose 1-phosphate adenosyltransferase